MCVLQRYFVNDTFYRPGGPVFLMIGGEGPANPAWMQYGTWLLYAQKLGALCLLLEHRFYGKSHPTEWVSERKERMKERALRVMNTRWCYKPLTTHRFFSHESVHLSIHLSFCHWFLIVLLCVSGTWALRACVSSAVVRLWLISLTSARLPQRPGAWPITSG